MRPSCQNLSHALEMSKKTPFKSVVGFLLKAVSSGKLGYLRQIWT